MTTDRDRWQSGWRRHALLAGVCASGALLAWVVLSFAVPPRQRLHLENSFRDSLLQSSGHAPASDRIVFLAIDAASLMGDTDLTGEAADEPVLAAMQRGWPWSHDVHARVVERLCDAGADLVIYDLLFPHERQGTDIFAAALLKYKDRVIVASDFQQSLIDPAGGQLVARYRAPSAALLPGEPWRDGRTGVATLIADPDGIIRGWRPAFTLEELNGQPASPDSEIYPTLALAALRRAGAESKVPPPDADGMVRLRFCSPDAWKAHSLASIFIPRLWRQNFASGAALKGKIVFVGPTAPDFHDIKSTPHDASLPGPILHMSALSAALTGSFHRLATSGGMLAITLAAGLAGWIIAAFVRNPLVAVAAVGSAAALYWYGAGLTLVHGAGHSGGILLSGTLPLAVLGASSLAGLSWQAALQRIERGRARRMLERMVSRDLARELLDEKEAFRSWISGVWRTPTTLFSDLRGFTALTETAAEPMKLVAQLNEYLGEMTAIVFRHGGQLDKFIGDAVMAAWGTLRSAGAEEDARRSLRCALEMRVRLRQLGDKWLAEGYPVFAAGIGINHGPAIFAGVGNEEKTEFTVLGDAVNVASRLEGITKRYGLDIIVSLTVAELGGDEFIFRPLDLVRVAGRQQPVSILALVDAVDRVTEAEKAWLAGWREALDRYYGRRFAAAAQLFDQLQFDRPDDKACAAYLDRCRLFLEIPPPDDWDAVEDLQTK